MRTMEVAFIEAMLALVEKMPTVESKSQGKMVDRYVELCGNVYIRPRRFSAVHTCFQIEAEQYLGTAISRKYIESWAKMCGLVIEEIATGPCTYVLKLPPVGSTVQYALAGDWVVKSIPGDTFLVYSDEKFKESFKQVFPVNRTDYVIEIESSGPITVTLPESWKK